MGFIRDKLEGFVKKAAETATETVKEITADDTKDVLDILGDVAKIGILVGITVFAVKHAGTTGKVVSRVPSSEVIQPIASAATPVVQIFLGEGKGVHIG